MAIVNWGILQPTQEMAPIRTQGGSAPNGGMNRGLNSGMNAGMGAGMNAGANSGMSQGMNSGTGQGSTVGSNMGSGGQGLGINAHNIGPMANAANNLLNMHPIDATAALSSGVNKDLATDANYNAALTGTLAPNALAPTGMQSTQGNAPAGSQFAPMTPGGNNVFNQSPKINTAGPLSLQNIQQMAAQQFPNNPVMQQVAVTQAAEESGLLGGKPSQLAQKYNNLFGMSGSNVTMTNSAGQDRHSYATYNNPQESMAAYAKLMNNPRYKGVMSAQTPEQAFSELQKAGYATDPNYANTLNAVHDKIMGGTAKIMGASQADVDKIYENYGSHYNTMQDKIMRGPARILGASEEDINKMYEENESHYAPNPQLHNITSIQQAHEEPTPDVQSGIPITKEMEQAPAFQQAFNAYAQARQAGTTKSPYVVSVDFSQPATAKRLNVYNAETGKVVFSSEVAQGSNPNFSNEPGSHASSLGTFQTQQTYDGHNGYSLRIKGLDKGVNDNAESRDVVVHGANYIGDGKTGRSFGCFAVPNSVAPKLINLIKDGVIINAYAPTQQDQGYGNDNNSYNANNTSQVPAGVGSGMTQAQNQVNPIVGLLGGLFQ